MPPENIAFHREERLRVAAWKCTNPRDENGVSADWVMSFLGLCNILKNDRWIDALARLAKYWEEKYERPLEKRGLLALLKMGIAGAAEKVIRKEVAKVYKHDGATAWLRSSFPDELIAADTKPDKPKKNTKNYPDDPMVLKLAREIKKKINKERSKLDIAKEICAGAQHNPQSLLRQLRRYRHLLD